MSLTRRQFLAGATSAAAVVAVAPALYQEPELGGIARGLTVADLIRARDTLVRNSIPDNHGFFLYSPRGRIVPTINANGAPRPAQDIFDEFYGRYG